MHALTQLKKATPLIFISFVLGCFAFLPIAQAVVPPPDGGYPNGNTAEGDVALQGLTTGSFNTALGIGALFSDTAGSQNTATGAGALFSNTGSGNTAVGVGALFRKTIGSGNTAVGTQALSILGGGSQNIAIGNVAGSELTLGNLNIYIGNIGGLIETGIIRIGDDSQSATFIAGINGTPITGAQIGVTSDGQLGVLATSSARFKNEIKPMDKVSETILALKPVTFHYKKEIDPKGIIQFGLVAEEVEKVNSALITRDRDGKPYTVRYDAVNAMLLNEFLKEHQKVEAQGATITRLEKQVEALSAGLRKVSAQLELSKSAPRTVLNNQ